MVAPRQFLAALKRLTAAKRVHAFWPSGCIEKRVLAVATQILVPGPATFTKSASCLAPASADGVGVSEDAQPGEHKSTRQRAQSPDPEVVFVGGTVPQFGRSEHSVAPLFGGAFANLLDGLVADRLSEGAGDAPPGLAEESAETNRGAHRNTAASHVRHAVLGPRMDSGQNLLLDVASLTQPACTTNIVNFVQGSPAKPVSNPETSPDPEEGEKRKPAGQPVSPALDEHRCGVELDTADSNRSENAPPGGQPGNPAEPMDLAPGSTTISEMPAHLEANQTGDAGDGAPSHGSATSVDHKVSLVPGDEAGQSQPAAQRSYSTTRLRIPRENHSPTSDASSARMNRGRQFLLNSDRATTAATMSPHPGDLSQPNAPYSGPLGKQPMQPVMENPPAQAVPGSAPGITSLSLPSQPAEPNRPDDRIGNRHSPQSEALPTAHLGKLEPSPAGATEHPYTDPAFAAKAQVNLGADGSSTEPAAESVTQTAEPMKTAFLARLKDVAERTASSQPPALSKGPMNAISSDGFENSGQAQAGDPVARVVPDPPQMARPRVEERPSQSTRIGKKEEDPGNEGETRLEESTPSQRGPETQMRPAWPSRPAVSPPDTPPEPQPASTGRTQAVAPLETIKPATHEIKLVVGAKGEERVEVRVAERNGDIHVAVRTSDSRLATELREDLPTLAAKLEQTGYRTDTWHPGSASPDRPAEMARNANSQDSQSGFNKQGGGQGEPQQRDQRDPENPQKDDRKDFEWLFSSLE
jgi:hypothetical protein